MDDIDGWVIPYSPCPALIPIALFTDLNNNNFTCSNKDHSQYAEDNKQLT